MPILPPRPLRLRASFVLRCWVVALLVFAAAAALVGGVTWWQGGEAKHILADADVWEHGEIAADSSVSGKERSQNFVVNSYELEVTFTDRTGQPHHGQLEFTLLFRSVDRDSEPEVHYDPRDPSRFALSWAVDRSGSRWAAVIVLWAILSLVGAVIGLLGVAALRAWLDARACAAASDELAATLLSIQQVRGQNGRPTNKRDYFFRVKLPAGREVERAARIQGAHTPLWTDDAQHELVVLVSRKGPHRPLAVRSDLHPFAFSPDEAQAIRQRAGRPTPIAGEA